MERLVKLKKTSQPYIGLFMMKNYDVCSVCSKLTSHNKQMDPSEQFVLDNIDDVYRVGTFAHIQNIAPTPGGALQVCACKPNNFALINNGLSRQWSWHTGEFESLMLLKRDLLSLLR